MSKKVSIEVGHGGSDPGAVSGGFLEKDINLVVSLELERQLKRHGITTLISRTTDCNDPVTGDSGFYAKAVEWKPDIGVSVHTNAGGGNGFEVFRRQNNYTAESNKLCQAIVDEVKTAGQVLRNPTIKDSAFLMDSLSCPTAYLELGFIDNPTDRARWDTPEKQRNFAVAYAKGILKYLGIAWIAESSTSASPSNSATAPITDEPLYRVQVGAFRKQENAAAMLAEVKAKGFSDAFIANAGDGLLRVQVGAFKVQSNAETALKAVKAVYSDAFITGTTTDSATTPTLKSIDEIAREVIAGNWGNGDNRRARLTAAGYDYNVVQARVNEILAGK